MLLVCCLALTVWSQRAAEVSAGFDTVTNGFADQKTHDEDREAFEERETAETGLGPLFNAQSCAECHSQPVTGGIAQVSELRAGYIDGANNFVPPTLVDGRLIVANRSLFNQRAICSEAQEHVPDLATIRTRRMSTNVLGLGYVEAIADSTFQAIRNAQPNGMKGQIVWANVPEGGARVGRFGWKDQEASLLSFSSGAYINEMGITNRLNLSEVTFLCDQVPDNAPCEDDPHAICGEDPEDDTSKFARFMRATKPPSRDTALAKTAEARSGATIFNAIGCAVCHTSSIATAADAAPVLANKVIHPYSDFLLHDVGTGDGIAQTNVRGSRKLDQSTRFKLRTAPLWGLRTHNELMHDGETKTLNEAILRHRGEAARVISNYLHLEGARRAELIAFLKSL